MKKIYVSIWALLLSTIALSAQEVVTIEQCMQWAIAQTSANVQKNLNEKILKINLNNAASHVFPKLEINGQWSYQSDVPEFNRNYVPLIDVNNLSKMQYHIGLDLEQVVFEGFKIFYGRKYAHLQNDAEIYKIELSINDMKSKVISLYLNLLIVDKQMKIIENVQSTFDDQIKQLNSMLKEGVVSPNTLSQLELEALKMEQKYDGLKSKHQSVVVTLSILTGRDLTKAIFEMPQIANIENSDSSSRLEFEIFDNQIKQMDFQRKLHFSNSLPKISIFATGGYGRPDYRYFLAEPDWYYYAGVKLTIPVIDWAKTSGLGKVINIQKEILESQEADFNKSNRIAIQDKLNEIKRIEHLLVLDSSITEKYKMLTRAYSSQLINGTITAFDYIKQHNDESQSLMNQELHSIQLLKAKYELLALKGKL